MKKLIKILVLVLVFIAIYLIAGNKDKGVAEQNTTSQSVKIGLVAPLSGDGAPYGESVLDGATLAIEELNKRSGIEYKYELVVEDGECSGAPAASAAQKLVNVDRVEYIVGGACSGETLAMAPITEQAGVLLISPFSSSSDITSAGEYVYRTVPSDATSGIFIADYIDEKHESIALISENTDYSKALRERVATRLKENNSNVVFNELFNSDTKDFRSQVLSVKNSGADSIFVNPQSEANFLAILTQLDEQGFDGQVYGFFLTSENIANNPLAKNVIMFDVPNISDGKQGSNFSESYLERFGKNPNYPFGAASAYDDVNLIANGIERYGDSADNVIKYLDSIKKYDGASGSFRFDENGDPVGYSYLVKIVENGKFVVKK